MEALERAKLSLKGLHLGDCFGECFMGPAQEAIPKIQSQELPPGTWPYTDDTQMALSIVEILALYQEIEQEALAARFAAKMEPERGYGVGAFKLLRGVQSGVGWKGLSYSGFRGMGSFGNGAAMRAAPVGAFFADEPMEVVVEQARLSAEVTHAHPEGLAGGIAVAVAAALAWLWREGDEPWGMAWIQEILTWVPEGYTHEAIADALQVPLDATVLEAAKALGNGAGVTAPDTVPLCLWLLARGPGPFEPLMWDTVSALGDRDTTCAIVGSIAALALGEERLPSQWSQACEPYALELRWD